MTLLGPRHPRANAAMRSPLPRSAAGRDRLEVGALALVGLGERQHLRVRLDAPAGARLAVDVGPPALVPRQPLVAHRRPVAQDLRPARVAVLQRLLPLADLRD